MFYARIQHNFAVIRSAGNSTYNFVNPVRRDVVSVGNTGDNVTIRFQTDNEGPWIMHWFVIFSTHIFLSLTCLSLVILIGIWICKDISSPISCLVIGTELTMFQRGLAIVLAENVPAIAKTEPPGTNSTYLTKNFLTWTLSSCLGQTLPRVRGVPAWGNNLMNG